MAYALSSLRVLCNPVTLCPPCAEAYRLLAAEGWLDLRRRRGAIVTERAVPRQQPQAQEDFSRSLRQLIAQVRAGGLSIKLIKKELERLNQELSV
jgi:DNA-binding transcriptional regulator YhcF (GntR family)